MMVHSFQLERVNVGQNSHEVSLGYGHSILGINPTARLVEMNLNADVLLRKKLTSTVVFNGDSISLQTYGMSSRISHEMR